VVYSTSSYPDILLMVIVAPAAPRLFSGAISLKINGLSPEADSIRGNNTDYPPLFSVYMEGCS
jgi:hypothetical protein